MSKLFKLKKQREVETFIDDRRGSRRHDMLLKVNYRDPATNRQKETLTKNISRSGLRFPIEAKVPKGTLLDLNIEDPNSNMSLTSRAKVIWLEEFITGDDADDVTYEVGVRLLSKRLY